MKSRQEFLKINRVWHFDALLKWRNYLMKSIYFMKAIKNFKLRNDFSNLQTFYDPSKEYWVPLIILLVLRGILKLLDLKI